MRSLFTVLCVAFLSTIALAGPLRCLSGDSECLHQALHTLNAQGQGTVVLEAGTSVFTAPESGNADDGFNALPVITGAVHIEGAGASQTVLVRDPSAPPFRFFTVAPEGSLTLQGLTLQGGRLDTRFSQNGGGIENLGTLTVLSSVVTDNVGRIGGGIHSRGQLTVRRSALTDNFAEAAGGGLTTFGGLIVDSVLLDNIAPSAGGIGISPLRPTIVRNTLLVNNIATHSTGGGLDGVGTLSLQGTLIEGNLSGLRGGGLALFASHLSMLLSQVARNQAEIDGGGLSLAETDADIAVSSLTGNTAHFGRGGGLVVQGGDVRLTGVLLAGNTARSSPDCAGPVVARVSLIGDPTGCDVR